MTGCQEAQHTLKKALLLQWQHGLHTYALFGDLVKAFDNIQHPLLFQILAKCGIPSPLITVIKKMYKNCTVRCKRESDTIEINYKTGVQQGDNASPVLLAYIMQAFLDTLKMMPKPSEFHHFKLPMNGNLKALNGRLMKQPTSSRLRLSHLVRALLQDWISLAQSLASTPTPTRSLVLPSSFGWDSVLACRS